MAVAILDTNVYIDHWERGLYQSDSGDCSASLPYPSWALVLSELRRGA